jgi:hypothetical protein
MSINVFDGVPGLSENATNAMAAIAVGMPYGEQ